MQRFFSRQINNDYCGPAVLKIILSAQGVSITQKEAALLAGTTRANGTSPQGLVKALRAHGLSVTGGNNRSIADLKSATQNGVVPVVCFTERHFSWGHYAIVLGFKGRYIELLDPAEKNGKGEPMSVTEFAKRWKDPLFTHTNRWAAFVSARATAPTSLPRRSLSRNRR